MRIAADMFLRCSSAKTRGPLFCPLSDEGCLPAEVPATSAATSEPYLMGAYVSFEMDLVAPGPTTQSGCNSVVFSL